LLEHCGVDGYPVPVLALDQQRAKIFFFSSFCGFLQDGIRAMTAGTQSDQIIGFIRSQLAAMYKMMDVKIYILADKLSKVT